MELQDYIRVVRAHWMAILLCTVLGGALAFGWTLMQPRVYTSTGSAIITTGSSESLGDALVGDNYAKSRVKSYLDIAKSRQVGEYAAAQLGIDASPDSLVARVAVSNPLDTAVLRVSATGPSPEDARALTEAWIAGMTQAVANIETGGEGGTTVVELRTLDSAGLPGAPSSPNTRMSVALGLLVGLAAGIGYALIRATIDRRLRSAEDIEREFDLPVVGTLPFDDNVARLGPVRATSDFAMKEAVRALRTNLMFLDVDHPPRVIVVTSSLPGDGKSTVSYKLAEAIAESGTNVVLIDADLRRPMLAKNLGLPDGAGLTDVLVGRVKAEDVLQPYGPTDNLYVMAAGVIPPNPSELLGSGAMRTLLYSFPEDAIVLVDTPPLIPVTDAAILTARTDGAVVVARAGRTTIDVLDKALQALDKVNGRALGVILDAVPRKGAHKDKYAYAYNYEYSDPKAPRRDSTASTPQAQEPRTSLPTQGWDSIVPPQDAGAKKRTKS
ncbi:polysaccharide biosynthesis tyrosine autokinase [Demequina sp. SYSU T00039]|uniref:Polysaccharide biosynthesis tyrosine autokinase n=1 Tax=Demequina lignilytica TaxID=3051663 RepID=A0AAW7M143_9MICO|nr:MULTISPECIES: polysaccharide biosynthesis tyrosine autokinase [unclassified Demequina]MDN4477446.1 polysaccharide biosynthesis tyrosine autokinase [Demequina sp. SYSU T00039-1]MDN4488203.1 polysaccharide biosynthesis tyrosine autokinase [Demequina sp. SYSU T00039]